MFHGELGNETRDGGEIQKGLRRCMLSHGLNLNLRKSWYKPWHHRFRKAREEVLFLRRGFVGLWGMDTEGVSQTVTKQ